ncbi:MAG TPA: exonuclease domain-containing protein [Burkholderiaceae bacterium]|nr:exonuclease domain-containing protein [Burkholderiaceae bacterium]
MFAPRTVFLDLETTGMSPERERITEIGLVVVEGGEVRERWQTLVNPGKSIPPDISWFTGITNEMVRDAPEFEQVADALWARLQGALLVAHNARFDYGFLKAEFARLGRTYITKPLCTVKLSRTLDPEQRSHSLDALIERWGLGREARHRAMGDAERLWVFAQKLAQRYSPALIEEAVRVITRRASLPPHLPPTLFDEMPATPGVYTFHAEHGQILYIGRSISLKDRVAAHFYDVKNEREQQLAAQVHRVTWAPCAGALSTAVREAEAIKTHAPAANVALRRNERAVLLQVDAMCRLRYLPAQTVADATEVPDGAEQASALYGPFASRAAARAAVVALAREFQLCLKTLGLELAARGEPAASGCFNLQIRRCLGACVNREPVADHVQRVHGALADHRLLRWPWPGAMAVVERSDDGLLEDWVVIDRWCVLGVVRSQDAALELARTAKRRFDLDLYRMVRKLLAPAADLQQAAVRLEALFPPAPAVDAGDQPP